MMKNMTPLFGLVLLSMVSFSHGLTVAFAGNVTLVNMDEFKFRSTSVSAITTGVYNGVFMKSVAVGASNTGANADILYAAATTALLDVPSTYVSYFTTNISGSASDPFAINFQASKSLIANTYMKIDEVDPSGTVVSTQSLAGVYLPSESNLQGDINFMTLKKSLEFSFDFNITVIFSDKVGTLNIAGNPVITPKSIETVVNIKNWKYANKANSLVLSIGVGSATGTASGSGNFAAGSGVEGVYMALNTEAVADGKTVDVKVSSFASLGDSNFGNTVLAARLNLKYAGSASFNVVKVTFPAGANDISYDPTIGAGANPPDSSAAAKGLLMIVILALLF